MNFTKPTISQLPIELLQRGRYQPRRNFDPVALQELAESIQANGLIQPIIVRPISPERYEIVAGERRWRAAQQAGLTEITCLVKAYTDEQAAAVATVENLQRQDLNPIEEAQALQQLIGEFGYLHEEVAAIIGKSRARVTNMLRLLQLADSVQACLIKGELSEGHGKVLAGLSQGKQIELAEQAIKLGWSVRKIEQMAKLDSNTQSHRKNANIVRLERLLSDQLGSKVEVDTDEQTKSGWLKIKFYDNQTLVGLLEKMGVPEEDVDV